MERVNRYLNFLTAVLNLPILQHSECKGLPSTLFVIQERTQLF